jgi:hypothetical protein
MTRLLLSVFALLFATSAVAAPAAWAQAQTHPPTTPPQTDDLKPGDAQKPWDAPKSMEAPKSSDDTKADAEHEKSSKGKQVRDKRKYEKSLQ